MKKGIFFREDSVWRKRLLQSIPVITGLFVVANGHADPITTIDSKLIWKKEQPMVPSLILMEILL